MALRSRSPSSAARSAGAGAAVASTASARPFVNVLTTYSPPPKKR